MLRRLMNAVELAYRANDEDVFGADGAPHAFEVSFDGDGFSEPYTVDASCTCGGWVRDWVQPDRDQTGRPEVADLLLEWDEHYESLTEADTPS